MRSSTNIPDRLASHRTGPEQDEPAHVSLAGLLFSFRDQTDRSHRYDRAGIRANVSDLPPVWSDHEVVIGGAESLGPCAITIHGIGACACRWP